MVLKRGRHVLAWLLVVALVSGCSHTVRQQVVAANSSVGGVSSGEPGQAMEHPVPPAVSALLERISVDLEHGRFRVAERDLRQAQRLSMSEPSVYFYWGRWAELQQRWHQAEQMYRRAISLANSNSVIQQRAMRALHGLPSTSE